MLIEENKLQQWIEKFYGYGLWSAKVWLISYEEGGGELPEEVAEKLNYFSAASPGHVQPILCNIRDLYRHVSYRDEGPKGRTFETLYDYRFATDAMLHGSWKNLIAFAHGYRRQTVPDVLTYQKDSFLNNGQEAVIRLFPLPSPHSHAWYYSWHIVSKPLEYIRKRELYEKRLFPDRIDTILNQMAIHQPSLVLMYGMNNIQGIKEAFCRAHPTAKFKMVKATKLEIPQHHTTDVANTRVVITTQIPTLRHNRVETGFNWHYFGQQVNSY